MDIIVYGGPVFTGLEDTCRQNQAILIRDGTIAGVGPIAELARISPEASGIDVGSRTILPGLIDAHRHVISLSDAEITPGLIVLGTVEAMRIAQEALAIGITTIRDPGCKHDGIFALKQAIDEGAIPGPTIYPAGPNPTGDAAPRTWRNYFVHGPWAMRKAVRELRRAGATWIKLVVSVDSRASGWRRTDLFLSLEELRAAVEEASALGLRVSGHIEGLSGASLAVQAGFSALEHAMTLDERLCATMAERRVFYVPTLFSHSAEGKQWKEPLRPNEFEAFQGRVQTHRDSFRRALAAEVPIAAGTDMYGIPPRDALCREIEALIQNGMAPAAALKAATIGGAAILGEEERFGALAAGMKADLIAVNGNPLDDIRALLNVDLVIKHGSVFLDKGMKRGAMLSGLLAKDQGSS